MTFELEIVSRMTYHKQDRINKNYWNLAQDFFKNFCNFQLYDIFYQRYKNEKKIKIYK